MVDTFRCPTCGAPLETPADASPTIQCVYCHNIIVVPETLRRPQAGNGPQYVQQAYAEKIHEMTQLIKSGKKIDAAKLYRQVFGGGLREAVDAIQELEATGRLANIPMQTTGAGEGIAGISGSQVEEIRQILRRGNKIEAIKRFRQITGVGLEEAKNAVERIERR